MTGVRALLLCLVAQLIVGCGASGDFREALPPVSVSPVPSGSAPIELKELHTGLRDGAVVGRYEYSLGLCNPLRDELYWGEGPLAVTVGDWRDAAHGTLDGLGFTVTNRPGDLFEDLSHDGREAAYLLGGVIEDVQIVACDALNVMTGQSMERESGTARVGVAWTLYSARQRAVVHRTRTEGASRLRDSRRNGVEKLVRDGFLNALERFAADPEFRALVTDGPARRAARRIPSAAPAALPDGVPLSRTPVRDRAETLRRAVVIVEAGLGHGSGFFIGPDLVLTNAHVVRGAPVVTVETLDGRRMAARVLRKHVPRDVALLRTDPRGRDGHPLPIRRAPVRTAETVFALGAPLERALAASITRGTVSARDRVNDHGMPLIQADVDIQPGNSGGPLVDEHGNVVGLSVSGVGARSIGVNFFVPIGDALTRLGLRRRAGSAAGSGGS
jgi:S1-C subfamily serine protease